MDEQFSKWWEQEVEKMRQGDNMKVRYIANKVFTDDAKVIFSATYSLGLAKGRKEGMEEAAGLLLERAGKCKEPYANGLIPADIRAVINILARIAQDIKKQSGIPANHEIYEERISNLKAALSEIVSDQNDFCTTCEEHIDTAADALNRDAIRQAAQGREGGERMAIDECWEVEVRVGGEPVLTIGSGHLSGMNDLDPYADTIRNCGEHLLAFIGPDSSAQTADRAAGGKCCEWVIPEDAEQHGEMESACQVRSYFNTHEDVQESFKFCPFCGKPIHVKES